jgi:hypothetical protein
MAITSLRRRRQDPPLNGNTRCENAFLDSRPSKKKQLRVRFINKIARLPSEFMRVSMASQSTLILTAMVVVWIIIRVHAIHQRSHHGQINNLARHLPVSFSWAYRDDVRPFYYRFYLNKQEEVPEYNGLDIQSLSDSRIFSRRIDPYDHKAYEQYREERLEEFDEGEYNFPKRYEPDEDVQDDGNNCKRTNWRTAPQPTCNTMHELSSELMTRFRPPKPSQDFYVRYLGYVRLLGVRAEYILGSTQLVHTHLICLFLLAP